MNTSRILLISSALTFSALCAAALGHRVEDAAIIPLVEEFEGRQPLPVDIPGRVYFSTEGQTDVHRIRLMLPDVSMVAAHEAIRLLVATHNTTPVLESAELRIVGTECRFATAPGTAFRNNETLTFARRRSCVPLRGHPSGEADLTIHFSVPGRAALWTWVQPPGGPPRGALIVRDPAKPESGARPALRGDFVDTFARSTKTRLQLLAYMWALPHAEVVLWTIYGVSAACALTAALLLPLASDEHHAARVGAAIGLAVASVALLYAACTPPFQAPDEPAHFLGVLYSVRGQRFDDEVQSWAQRAHFESLRFDAEERFHPSDMASPERQVWRHVAPTWFSTRSALVFFWRGIAAIADGWNFPALFLCLRIAHALLLAGAAALAATCVTMWRRSPQAWRALLPIWLVPSLPFFGMHISDHALLMSAYVLVAAAAAVLFAEERPPAFAGVLLGIALALAAAANRSALPLFPFGGALALLWFTTQSSPRDKAVFWIGVSSAMIGVAVTLPRACGPMATTGVPTVALLGLALSVALGYAADRMRGDWSARAPAFFSHAALAGAAAVVALLAASLFIDYPTLRAVDISARPAVGAYVREAVASAVTWPRLRHHDFLLSSSFWGAFGWTDRVLPEWAISVFVAVASLSAVWLLVDAGRRRDRVQLIRIAVVLAGAAASFVAYAVATLKNSPDLQGRYLFGLYLCVLTVICTGVSRRSTAAAAAAYLGVPLLVHAFTLAFVLSRYF